MSFSRALEILAVLRHQVSLWVDPEKANGSLPGKGPHREERAKREWSQGVLGVLVQSSVSGSALGAVGAALLQKQRVPRWEGPRGPL